MKRFVFGGGAALAALCFQVGHAGGNSAALRLAPVTQSALGSVVGLVAAPAAAPAVNTLADPWPRDVTLGKGSALVYQPQINSWKGNQLDWRVAVAITPKGSKNPVYGTVQGTARTDIDRVTRTVVLNDIVYGKVNFPTLPDNGAAYMGDLRKGLNAALNTMALDSLETALAASKTANVTSLPVRNDPPQVIVSYSQAIQVPVAGNPVFKSVQDTDLERVINTEALIVRTKWDSQLYLHVFDGWLTAAGINGPWTLAPSIPAGLNDLAAQLAQQGKVDLLDGGASAQPKPALANGVPAIYVTETPAELIVFKGQPDFVPVTGTGLLWASNSAVDVLINTANNDYYVLLSGRWFSAPSLNGPWSFVPSDQLPADFSRIPAKGSPASVVLASVAGTPQAQEAVIANSIPQTASISLKNPPSFTPQFDGPPQWASISGTTLQYVVNARSPVIEANPGYFYAVQGGVWFTATALTGPWQVATSLPAAIYEIPVSSPLHYVTYVQIYGVSNDTVYVGYTPGYLGTVVAPGGVVVYGTGYSYTPWIGNYWYGAPLTYGLAAAPVYNAAVGWTFGFAMGLTAAAWATPYYGWGHYTGAWYGAPCCGSASANVYRNWGTGVSSGTRNWWANSSGFGTSGSGYYSNFRGTTGTYNAARGYNYNTGTFNQGYNRTFNNAAGSGSVSRGETYNPYTGQRNYASNMNATGAGGSSISRTTAATAGPQGYGRNASTTTYNAKTGQTKTWSNGVPQNDHFAGSDGNVYRQDGSGAWQQHSAGGWGAANGDTSWADRDQQARTASADRTSSTFSSGWDRSGGLGGNFSSRFGGDSGGRFGSGGSWGSRFNSGSFGDRFGGRSFGGGFGGGRSFGGRR